MKIKINDRQNLLNQNGEQQVRQKLAAALSRFGHRITQVDVTLEDVNGPRGGIDKQVKLVARVKKQGQVVATVKDRSVAKAVSWAVTRVERGVARRIVRRNGGTPRQNQGWGMAAD